MKAMILKDLLCLKHQAKSVLLVLLVTLVPVLILKRREKQC